MNGDRYVVKPWVDVSRDMVPAGRWRANGYWIVDTTSRSNHIHFEHRVDAQERADRWNRNNAKEEVK